MKYNFCPVCGRPFTYKTIEGEPIAVCPDAGCGFIFWQNSKPCASVLLTNERGELLLTTRGVEPEKGKLDLPGGFLKEGEHPADGAKREIQEELGVEITVDRYLGFVIDRYDANSNYTLNIGVVATIVSGTPQPADDVAALEWVDPAKVDQSRLAFTNNAKFIQMWLADQQGK